MVFDINAIEQIIGYEFNDKMLLRKAFTHASYAYEHNQENNELMEFFGDSIMEFIVTEYLYKKIGGDEGLLTKYRAEMVSKTPLNDVFHQMGLAEFIFLGNGQQKQLCCDEKLFSSVYEAIVCAIYLDGGIANVRKFIKNTIIKKFEQEKDNRNINRQDASAKSEFQEYVQKNKLGRIEYKLLSKTGPDHLAEFCVALTLNDKILARQKGYSKKSAEAKAAQVALKKLKAKQGR